MPSVMKSKIISVSIDRAPSDVYDFAVNPANLPLWAPAFSQGIRQVGGEWLVDTPDGPVSIRFVDRNRFGVLDHVVCLPNGDELLNPMRVVANGLGSEVMFVLFQSPDMTDEQFAADAELVRSDLQTLKAVLER